MTVLSPVPLKEHGNPKNSLFTGDIPLNEDRSALFGKLFETLLPKLSALQKISPSSTPSQQGNAATPKGEGEGIEKTRGLDPWMKTLLALSSGAEETQAEPNLAALVRALEQDRSVDRRSDTITILERWIEKSSQSSKRVDPLSIAKSRDKALRRLTASLKKEVDIASLRHTKDLSGLRHLAEKFGIAVKGLIYEEGVAEKELSERAIATSSQTRGDRPTLSLTAARLLWHRLQKNASTEDKESRWGLEKTTTNEKTKGPAPIGADRDKPNAPLLSRALLEVVEISEEAPKSSGRKGRNDHMMHTTKENLHPASNFKKPTIENHSLKNLLTKVGQMRKGSSHETIRETSSEETTTSKEQRQERALFESTENVTHAPSTKESHKEALAQKIVDAKETVRHFARNLRQEMEHYKPPMSRLQLSLEPKDLGSVEVTLLSRGNQLHIQVHSNPTAIGVMASQGQELKSQLVSMGFTDVQMQFNMQQQHQHQRQQRRDQTGTARYLEMEEIPDFYESIDLIVPQYV